MNLSEYLDSVTGLGYKLKMKSRYGGFFNVAVSRKVVTGFSGEVVQLKKYKTGYQTLGKDSFSDSRLKALIEHQIDNIQKQIMEDEIRSKNEEGV